MVKIVKGFKILHPIEKYVDEVKEVRMLMILGKAALNCKEPHPIHAGWYRLNLLDGKLDIAIAITEIIDVGTNQDLFPEFKDNLELMDGFNAICDNYMRKKFLNI